MKFWLKSCCLCFSQTKPSAEVDAFKSHQQWLRVEATEELIKAQKNDQAVRWENTYICSKINLIISFLFLHRDEYPPRERFNKLKENFDETKSRLCTDLDNELAKRKM